MLKIPFRGSGHWMAAYERPNTVSVDILDKDQVACPPDEELALTKALAIWISICEISSTGKVVGLERVAIMAALNISHELLALKSGDSPIDANEDQERLSALNSQLDEVLYQLRQLEIN